MPNVLAFHFVSMAHSKFNRDIIVDIVEKKHISVNNKHQIVCANLHFIGLGMRS